MGGFYLSKIKYGIFGTINLTDPISSSDDSSAPTPELRLVPRFRSTGDIFLWSSFSGCDFDCFVEVESFLFDAEWSVCLHDFWVFPECLYLESALLSLFLKSSRPSWENVFACPNPEALLRLVLLPPSKCDKLGRRTPQLKLSTLSPYNSQFNIRVLVTKFIFNHGL